MAVKYVSSEAPSSVDQEQLFHYGLASVGGRVHIHSTHASKDESHRHLQEAWVVIISQFLTLVWLEMWLVLTQQVPFLC